MATSLSADASLIFACGLPKKLSREFLLVDLVNNLDRLAESKNEVLSRVRDRVSTYDAQRLRRAADDYGNVRTKKFFREAMNASTAPHAC
jgi:hypothetical protein